MEQEQGTSTKRKTSNPFSGYAQEELPLSSYAGLAGTYAAVFAGFLLSVKNSDRELPERIEASDTLLLGIATHKLSRIIAKDVIMSPVRAPFAKLEEPTGAGEVGEKARGWGLQRAIGDLLTCPWCVSSWVAAGLTYSFVRAPRTTRLVDGILTATAVSDFLQHAYVAAKKHAE